MGCNFKNARNGKSMPKTSKRQSLKALALKNETVMTVSILKKSKALLSSNYFHTNLLIFFEIQTIIKSHSLMLGTSNFAILHALYALSISGIL